MKFTEKERDYLMQLVLEDIKQRQIEAEYFSGEEILWKKKLVKKILDTRNQ